MSKWKFDAHFCNGKIRKLLELNRMNFSMMQRLTSLSLEYLTQFLREKDKIKEMWP
jgi:hypothetical protein